MFTCDLPRGTVGLDLLDDIHAFNDLAEDDVATICDCNVWKKSEMRIMMMIKGCYTILFLYTI